MSLKKQFKNKAMPFVLGALFMGSAAFIGVPALTADTAVKVPQATKAMSDKDKDDKIWTAEEFRSYLRGASESGEEKRLVKTRDIVKKQPFLAPIAIEELTNLYKGIDSVWWGSVTYQIAVVLHQERQHAQMASEKMGPVIEYFKTVSVDENKDFETRRHAIGQLGWNSIVFPIYLADGFAFLKNGIDEKDLAAQFDDPSTYGLQMAMAERIGLIAQKRADYADAALDVLLPLLAKDSWQNERDLYIQLTLIANTHKGHTDRILKGFAPLVQDQHENVRYLTVNLLGALLDPRQQAPHVQAGIELLKPAIVSDDSAKVQSAALISLGLMVRQHGKHADDTINFLSKNITLMKSPADAVQAMMLIDGPQGHRFGEEIFAGLSYVHTHPDARTRNDASTLYWMFANAHKSYVPEILDILKVVSDDPSAKIQDRGVKDIYSLGKRHRTHKKQAVDILFEIAKGYGDNIGPDTRRLARNLGVKLNGGIRPGLTPDPGAPNPSPEMPRPVPSV